MALKRTVVKDTMVAVSLQSSSSVPVVGGSDEIGACELRTRETCYTVYEENLFLSPERNKTREIVPRLS